MEDSKQPVTMVDEVIEDQTVVNEEHHHHHHSEHSHRNGHHRHRHRRSSSSKKKTNKFIAFLKKHRSALVNILSCTVSVILLVILALNFDNSPSDEAKNDYMEITQSNIRIETSLYQNKIQLVSDAISYYMSPDNTESASEVYKSFEGHKNTLNAGLPLSFTYRVTGLPSGVKIKSSVLEISENDDYSDALTYQLDLETSIMDIYNLKTGTKYYYRVNLTLDDSTVIGMTGIFETEKSPRILNIDGIVNGRDIGGWTTTEGKTIKQGLLFRGNEIDGAVVAEYDITDQGVKQMIGVLGVRYDMDLRFSSDVVNLRSALGKNVRHKFYAIGQYADVLDEYNRSKIAEIFRDLANKENYPIYLHCTYGRDRTGTVAYLIGALLGMTDEDLDREYELSAFTYSTINEEEFSNFKEAIGMLNGNTTQKKVEGFLLSIGVTEQEIATIREIFLEDQ